jgi:integrase
MSLRWAGVVFDNLPTKLHGKGSKDRLVPFRLELRRHLYRWRQANRLDLVFPSRDRQWVGRRDQLRDVKQL